MLVQHHIKYKEIHGEDVIVLMDKSEHNKLHIRLRKEGLCKVPIKELRKISLAARKRTDIDKRNQVKYRKAKLYVFRFTTRIEKGWFIDEQIRYNFNTGNVRGSCYFFSRQ